MNYVNFGSAGLKVSRLALGLGLRGQADEAAAQRMIERAIDLGSKAVDYRYLLGFSLAYAGDCGRARPWFEQAQALDPESQPARDGLALCP